MINKQTKNIYSPLILATSSLIAHMGECHCREAVFQLVVSITGYSVQSLIWVMPKLNPLNSLCTPKYSLTNKSCRGLKNDATVLQGGKHIVLRETFKVSKENIVSHNNINCSV